MYKYIETEWHVSKYWQVDGDTVRFLGLRKGIRIADGLLADVYHNSQELPDGLPVRVIHLDTPEDHQEGHDLSVFEAINWLKNAGDKLMVTTWGTTGGYDRILGDFWIEGDRNNSLSKWMLTYGNNGKGWLPYIKGK